GSYLTDADGATSVISPWAGCDRRASPPMLQKGDPADAHTSRARPCQDHRQAGWAGDAAIAGWVRAPECHRTGSRYWPAVQPVPGRRRGGVGHGDRDDGVVTGALPAQGWR